MCPETSVVKKIYKWQPLATRPVGRPKNRWDDDVKNDLRKTKITKWSELAQDRLEWKKIVEKAKTTRVVALNKKKKKKKHNRDTTP